jgi:DNA repair protein RecO (recombination protein O)
VRPDRTEAIILQTFPSRERDKLVVFLTPEKGKRKGWAYGVRSLRNRFGSSLEPLAKTNLVFLEKENADAVRIESAELVRSAFPAQQNLAGSLAGTYLAETVDTFVQPDDPSELVYRLLDRAVEALIGGTRPEHVVAYVEVWALKLAGIFPSIRVCTSCQRPLELPLRHDEHGRIVCADCAGGAARVLPNRVAELLDRMLRLPVETFAAKGIPDGDLFEIRAFARDLRRNFLGHELKSHDLLQSVLRAGNGK